MSGPLICRTIQSNEKDISDSLKSFPALERSHLMVSPDCILPCYCLRRCSTARRLCTSIAHQSGYSMGRLISYIEVLGT